MLSIFVFAVDCVIKIVDVFAVGIVAISDHTGLRKFEQVTIASPASTGPWRYFVLPEVHAGFLFIFFTLLVCFLCLLTRFHKAESGLEQFKTPFNQERLAPRRYLGLAAGVGYARVSDVTQ